MDSMFMLVPIVLPPVVSASMLYTLLMTPVHTITGIDNANYIAFHSSGDMFVSSYGENCVYV